MKAAGVKFTSLPESDVAKMKKLSDEIIRDQANSDPVSKKVVDLVMKTSDTISQRARMTRKQA
jgi:hypothetical protein